MNQLYFGFKGGGGGGMRSPQAMIPKGVIANWYENFLYKVKAGGVVWAFWNEKV